MKLSVFIATSKDGYIATKDGDISFLEKLNVKGDGGYENYYSSVDALIYGTKTYEKVKSFNLPEWPYKEKMSYILTSGPERYELQEDVEFTSKSIQELVNSLKTKYKHVWVMGGANVINQFIELDLIDELYISEANVKLSKGIKLFKDPSVLDKYVMQEEIDYGDIITRVYK